MATRYMTLTLRLRVDDLDDEVKEQLARDSGQNPADFSSVADLQADDVARVVADTVSAECQDEVWAGTNLYAHISEADVIACKFEDQAVTA